MPYLYWMLSIRKVVHVHFSKNAYQLLWYRLKPFYFHQLDGCDYSDWPSQVGPQSLCNRSFGGGFVTLSLDVYIFLWYKGFCHRTESNLFPFSFTWVLCSGHGDIELNLVLDSVQYKLILVNIPIPTFAKLCHSQHSKFLAERAMKYQGLQKQLSKTTSN